MKSLKIYSLLLVAFLLFSQSDLFAQHHKGHKQSEKNRKEYYKKQDKKRKHYQKQYKADRYEDRHYSHSKRKRHNGPPSWARAHGYHAKHHVYFRDYNTFYDPHRGGYVYRHNNRWLFSSSVPTFLVGVNLNSARVQFMSDIPLDRHPEQYYSRYSDRYPRDPSVNINISF